MTTSPPGTTNWNSGSRVALGLASPQRLMSGPASSRSAQLPEGTFSALSGPADSAYWRPAMPKSRSPGYGRPCLMVGRSADGPVAKILLEAGFEVDAVATEPEALAALDRKAWTLVFVAQTLGKAPLQSLIVHAGRETFGPSGGRARSGGDAPGSSGRHAARRRGLHRAALLRRADPLAAEASGRGDLERGLSSRRSAARSSIWG